MPVLCCGIEKWLDVYKVEQYITVSQLTGRAATVQTRRSADVKFVVSCIEIRENPVSAIQSFICLKFTKLFLNKCVYRRVCYRAQVYTTWETLVSEILSAGLDTNQHSAFEYKLSAVLNILIIHSMKYVCITQMIKLYAEF